ncbi:Uncharacterized protein TCM_019505 [Theobroma cacao]|uniref:Uncharacterized protein n=1 Tax=Theobroma cacao TaxID=3641 RepID=A0A061EHZ8_THECC|nr:Uncharacterized protein TCM_019505 [Theobroma cacao]
MDGFGLPVVQLKANRLESENCWCHDESSSDICGQCLIEMRSPSCHNHDTETKVRCHVGTCDTIGECCFFTQRIVSRLGYRLRLGFL